MTAPLTQQQLMELQLKRKRRNAIVLVCLLGFTAAWFGLSLWHISTETNSVAEGTITKP